jgi:hypothetical protein
MGCVVEAGDHDVELTFRPWSFRAGAIISGAGLALALFSARLLLARAKAPRNAERG